MKRELCRTKDERGSCVAWISLEGGKIRVDRFDTGPGTREILGGDYESWIEIPTHALPDLAFALLADRMATNLQAVSDTAAFCEKYGIKHEKGSWS